jgi:hypothetical protein
VTRIRADNPGAPTGPWETVEEHPFETGDLTGKTVRERRPCEHGYESRMRTVHCASGWMRACTGRWVFLHAGGGIGADGMLDTPVEFAAPLSAYRLPVPPEDPAGLWAAAQQSTGLLEAVTPRVGVVLAGLAYRTAAGPARDALLAAGMLDTPEFPPPLSVYQLPASSAVTLTGPAGCGKTTAADIAVHHFAPGRRGTALVLSPPGPGRGVTGATDDAVLDLTGAILDDCEADLAGTSLIRRARDVLLAAEDPAGCRVMLVPGGAAVPQYRHALTVPMTGAEVSGAARASLMSPESRYGRAAATASFIAWLASRRGRIPGRMNVLTARYAQAWRDEGHDAQTARSLAHLAAGWKLMLDHLTGRLACDTGSARHTWRQAWAALGEAGRAHADAALMLEGAVS